MSSKQSTSKPDPRIAQKEAMVTRHKSAQMKRQLRDKNRSMKHLTDLLKSPSRDTQTVSKIVQTKTKSPKLKSLLKSAEKVQKLPEKVFRLSKMLRKKIAVVQDAEYYPNKRKRKVDVKKVELKPSHQLQMIGSITGSVKRKSGVPLKASCKPKQVKASSPEYSRLSMAEAIRIVEADLTEEDMMEILTCPSPVWWEDPPDEEYIEDAIFTQSPPQPTRNVITPDPKTHEAVQKETEVNPPAANSDDYVADKPIEITNLDSKGDKFLKKRSKLEGLLGNIKHKSAKVYQSRKDTFSEDLVVICSNYRKESRSNNKDNKSNSDNVKTGETQSESDGDEILFHDTSMNEDELLRDLENMDIPIENQSRQSDVIVIDDDEDVFLDKTTDSSSNKEISSDETRNNNKLKTPKVEATLKTFSNDKLNVIPKSMPFLEKLSVGKEFSSPKSIDSMSSKTSASSQDTDTISDTNIRFLLDDEVEEQSKNIAQKEKADELKSNEDLDKGDGKNISDGLEKPDKFKANEDFSLGYSKNITDNLEEVDKLKSSKDLNAGDSQNIFENFENTDKLESDKDLSLDDHKSITGDLEHSKESKSSKDLNEDHNKKVFDGVENPDNLKSSKVLHTCDDVETVAGSNSNKGFNAGDQNIDSAESLKKYKNTSKKSITVFKIIEESDNSETDNSNSNNGMPKENDIVDKEKSGVKINDYYKKCKKVYQKRSKKIEDRTDINKNLKQISDIENDTKFILCELCKPKTKKVSDDKNVKYCLKCSSIFDSKDCTYCIEKSKSKVFTCVPCEIRFCCESFYYKHAMEHMDMGVD